MAWVKFPVRTMYVTIKKCFISSTFDTKTMKFWISQKEIIEMTTLLKIKMHIRD